MNSRAEYGGNSIPRVTISQFHDKDGNSGAGAPDHSGVPDDPPEEEPPHPKKRTCGSTTSLRNSQSNKRKKTNHQEEKSSQFPAIGSKISSRATPLRSDPPKTNIKDFFKPGNSTRVCQDKGTCMIKSYGLTNGQQLEKQRLSCEGSCTSTCFNKKFVSGNTISQGDVIPKVLPKLT